ncbi:MAG: RNA-binding protein [Bacteroidaceae bacterium]|nr:RNA-binding protein [Bacteroidaceae bacterium]
MKTIFFDNLPKQADTNFLKFIIKQFGRGYDIRIIPNKDKDGLQYGFAEMIDEEADALLEFFNQHTLKFMDVTIRIRLAKGQISARSERINQMKKKRQQAILERKKRRLAREMRENDLRE